MLINAEVISLFFSYTIQIYYHMMKHYFLYLFLACTLAACGGGEQKEQNIPPEGIAEEPALTATQTEGRQLIKQSDCSACHLDDAKLVGPGYQEVAEKYPHNDSTVTYLAQKIIKGGSGVWGNVPMTPHPQHSVEEAQKMAKYILTLSNK
jgi:cytochrome c